MTNIFTINEVCESLEDGNWIESKDQSKDGIRLIQTGNIKSGYFEDNPHKARYISEKTFNKLNCKEVFEGDILISRLPDPVGRGCILPKLENRSITAVDCTIVRVKKNIINNKYLLYILQSPQYQFQVNQKVTGTTRSRISRKNLGEINIPVPPLQEQEKIVERLDKVFENIDKVFVAKESEILSLTNLFDSFLDNTIEEFSESEQKLGEYYDVRDGTHDSPKYYEKGYPLITSKNLKDGQLNFEKIKFISEEDFNKINERSKVNKGDVLMAMIGTIGNPVVIKDNSKLAIKNVALFKLNKNQSSEYLYYFLKSNKVKKKMIAEAKGTTQKFVGLGYLRNFTITGKFDLNAENEVVFLISKIENIINKFINNQQQIYTKLLELKKSILNKEFSYE